LLHIHAPTLRRNPTTVKLDAAPGQLSVEFDGSDASAPFSGVYSRSEEIPLAGNKRWKTASFNLDAARFLNSQNAGGDFRVVAEAA
jgi:hypothetical protein